MGQIHQVHCQAAECPGLPPLPHYLPRSPSFSTFSKIVFYQSAEPRPRKRSRFRTGVEAQILLDAGSLLASTFFFFFSLPGSCFYTRTGPNWDNWSSSGLAHLQHFCFPEVVQRCVKGKCANYTCSCYLWKSSRPPGPCHQLKVVLFQTTADSRRWLSAVLHPSPCSRT